MDGEGNQITAPSAILDMEYNFYEKLYHADDAVEFALSNHTDIRVLPNDRDALDGNISEAEITKAVFDLKKDKTPGCDGLTAELYQHFWTEIGEMYVENLYECINNGVLNYSARKGTIALIPKKDRNLTSLRNWRPLTMLTTDYKILASVLATRLKTVLPYIINNDQAGFMSGRQISTVIRRAIDAMEMGDDAKEPGYLLNADFEKCFDLISYEGIKGSLRYFGIGQKYIDYVCLLLYQFQSCVTNNGYLTQWFDVQRSCHQGCPLAPFLMICCAEIMAIAIRDNPAIEPYNIAQYSHSIMQFADDTQVPSKATQQSLNGIHNVFHTMQKNIGFKINTQKTVVYLIGHSDPPLDNKGFQFTTQKPSILGVNTANIQQQLLDINTKATHVMQNWQNRTLTLRGKVLVINSLVASLYVYILQIAENPPEELYTEFLNNVNRFLWGSTRARVSHKLLTSSKKNGGLKLVDIQKRHIALKIQWLFRVDDYVESIICSFIPEELGILFFDCYLNKNDVNEVLKPHVTPFWRQVFQHWFQFNWAQNICEQQYIESQVIWCNSQIKSDGRILYNAKYIRNGCVYVKDLLNENGGCIDYATAHEKFEISIWDYNIIVASIPKKWKKTHANGNINPPLFSMYDTVKSKSKPVKYVYNILIGDDELPLKRKYASFIKKFCTEISYECYCKAFMLIHFVTNITKYRDFQYRLLINLIYANDQLFHWGKKDSQRCEYCPEPKQTLLHLLWECPHAQRLWE